MLSFDAAQIGQWVGSLMWPLIRIGAFFMAAPIVGAQLVPARIRILFALLVSMILIPVLPPAPAVDALSAAAVVLVAQQVLIGVGLAFVLQIFMHLFVMTGQIMAMKMGLGFASMMDPANGVSVTVLSQFYLLLATLLFLSVNGHLVMIDVLVESFHALPVGTGLGGNALWMLAGWASWMFAGALLMALPIVTTLLIINTSLGIITRAAPQLNIFAIGFPMMLVLGLGAVWLSMIGVLPHFNRFSEQALAMMRDLIAT